MDGEVGGEAVADRDAVCGALHERWDVVRLRWDETLVHDEFVRLCFAAGRLDVAARRYREALAEAERKPVADKRLQAVVFLAIQGMQGERGRGVTRTPRWIPWVAGVLCALSVGTLVFALLR